MYYELVEIFRIDARTKGKHADDLGVNFNRVERVFAPSLRTLNWFPERRTPRHATGHWLIWRLFPTGERANLELEFLIEEWVSTWRFHEKMADDAANPIEDILVDSGMLGHPPAGKYKK